MMRVCECSIIYVVVPETGRVEYHPGEVTGW